MLYDDDCVDTQNNQHIVFDDDCFVGVLILILLEYEMILANVNLGDECMVLSVQSVYWILNELNRLNVRELTHHQGDEMIVYL